MLRGLRMARIRPSRLRILNAGVKIRIGFTKNSNFQNIFENVGSKGAVLSEKVTPNTAQGSTLGGFGGHLEAWGGNLGGFGSQGDSTWISEHF